MVTNLSTPKYELGKLIRSARIHQGLNQYQLAKKAGVSQSTVTMLERGYSPNPSFGTAHLLATALNIPTATMLAAFICDWPKLLKDRGGSL